MRGMRYHDDTLMDRNYIMKISLFFSLLDFVNMYTYRGYFITFSDVDIPDVPELDFDAVIPRTPVLDNSAARGRVGADKRKPTSGTRGVLASQSDEFQVSCCYGGCQEGC